MCTFLLCREDCIVLSSRGTAAFGNMQFMLDLDSVGMFGPPFMTANGKSNLTKTSTASVDDTCCSLVHLVLVYLLFIFV